MRWPKRIPRLQFSLRSIFICVTVCGLVYGVLAHRESKRRKVIAEITSGGGSVSLHQTGLSLFPDTNVNKLTIPYDVLNDIDVDELGYFTGLSQVSVPDWTIQGGPDAPFDRYTLNLKFRVNADGNLETPFGLELGD